MRDLFIAVSKVFGLLQLYHGVQYIAFYLPMIPMLRQSSSGDDSQTIMNTSYLGANVTLTIISTTSIIILTFFIAWLLIYKATWLADRLNIPARDVGATYPTTSLLNIGTKLLGLYVIAQGIPSLVEALLNLRHVQLFSAYMWSIMLSPVFRVLIGILLVVKTKQIVQFITRDEELTEHEP